MKGASVGGVVEEEGEVLGSVKAVLKDFFCRQRVEVEETDKCEVCLGGRESSSSTVCSPFREDVVGVVAQALLLPPEGGRCLWLCGECSLAWRNLAALFFRLEELRKEFNDLRRRVGREVIVGSLGKSEGSLEEWEEEVRIVEHIFPSCVGREKVVDGLKSLWVEPEVPKVTESMEEVKEEPIEDLMSEHVDFCDFLEEEDDDNEKVDLLNVTGLVDKDDVKLNKMTPKVILQRLKETPEKAETSPDDEDTSNDKDFLPEDAAPSRRTLRTRRPFVDVGGDVNSDDSDSTGDERVTRHPGGMSKKAGNSSSPPIRAKRSKRSNDGKPAGTCSLCSLKFASKKEKFVHDELLHFQNASVDKSSVTRLFSRLCGKSSIVPADLATHEETFHSADLRFLCLRCTPHRKFSRPELLNAHSLIHSEEKHVPLRCLLCEKEGQTSVTFDSPSQLDSHLVRVHFFSCYVKWKPSKRPECANPRLKDPRILHKATCRWCTKAEKFSGLFRIKRHERQNHPEQFVHPCDTCGVKFTDTSEALTCQETHKTAEAGESTFKCFVCNLRLPSGTELREHLEVKHTTGGVNCDLCDDTPGVARKRHQGPMELKIHQARFHGGEWPFKCPQCGKGEESLQQVEDHILKSHGGVSSELGEEIRQNVGQRKCGRPYALVGGLLQPRKCAECGATFLSMTSLRKHRRQVHSLPRPSKQSKFVCEECGKVLSTKESLRLHTKSHRGEKDNVCEYCGKGFVSPGCLVLHLRIHTGERPYKCHICEKSFTQGAHLRAHWGYHKKIGTWKEKTLPTDQ